MSLANDPEFFSDEFAEMIGDQLTREYGSTVDHYFWCGMDKGEWKDCSKTAKHLDAGIDVTLRVMVTEADTDD